jgi:glutamine synthetase
VKSLQDGCVQLKELISHAHPSDKLKAAKHCRDDVLPAMLEVRRSVDALEGIVADDLWPLPTYQEMLFIK